MRVRRRRPDACHWVVYISLNRSLSLSLSLVDACFNVPRVVTHSPLYLGRSVRLRDGTRAEPRSGGGDGPSRLGGCLSRVSATTMLPVE